MRTMVLLAALAVPCSAPATTPADDARPPVAAAGGAPEQCLRPGASRTERTRAPVGPRRLGELPPGRLELAVLRKVDGCVIPAVVREGIGR